MFENIRPALIIKLNYQHNLFRPWPGLSKHHLPVGVEPYQYKQHGSERDQRGTPVAYKRQWNSNYRGKPDCHTNIDNDVKEKYGGYPICITTTKHTSLSLRNIDDPQKQEKIQAKKNNTSQETKAFADCAEYKVGSLFGNEIKPRLRTLQKPTSEEAATTYCDFTLADVVVSILAFSGTSFFRINSIHFSLY